MALINQPLSSGDQIKLLVFTLLFAPTVGFLVGAFPAIFLVFGLYMMKKNQDFSSIETAVKYAKGYIWLAFIGCLVSSLYWGNEYLNDKDGYGHPENGVISSLIFASIALAYLILVHFLFLKPLKSHREWIVVNGIFSSKPKSAVRLNLDVDIIKGEKLKQYSVADELLKWAKLKEDGHISEIEFKEARDKLLKRG
jgi:hypothetical protein